MLKTKALVLFSGGLDSLLAATVLKDQGIGVTALCFTSGFFGSDKAKNAAEAAGLPFKEIEISEDLLALVKNPPSGYGKHLNPCVDCHALMFKKAGEIMRQEGYDFIATGEVLGQRPFSQNKGALEQVAKLAGTEILRPLSAKLLSPTSAENRRIVKRHKLLDISGRSRERQIELAGKYQLIGYSAPAGGCLLTDPAYSGRLLKMLEFWPDCGLDDIELLKYGRIFWLNSANGLGKTRILLVIGRKQADNESLVRLAKKGDIMVELREMNGPTTLVRGLDVLSGQKLKKIKTPAELKMSELKLGEPMGAEDILGLASLLTAFYSVKARGKSVDIRILGY